MTWPLVVKVAVFGLLVAGPAAAQEAGDSAPLQVLELDLAQTLELAVARNLGLQRALLDRDEADESLRRAWMAFEPTFSAGLDRGGSQENTSDTFSCGPLEPGASCTISSGTTAFQLGLQQAIPGGGTLSIGWSMGSRSTDDQRYASPDFATQYLGMSVSQPLLSGFLLDPTTSGIRRAQTDMRIARIDFEEAIAALLGEAHDSWWSLWSAWQGRERARRSLQEARSQLADTEERISEGFLPPFERLGVLEQVAVAEDVGVQAEALLESADLELQVLLAFDLGDGVSRRLRPGRAPERDDGRVIPEAGELLARLRSQSPDQQRRQQQRLRSRWALREAIVSALPSLDLDASVYRSGFGESMNDLLTGNGDSSQPGWSIGLTLRGSLLGQRTASDIRAARRSERRERLRHREQEQRLMREVLTARSDLVASQAAVALAERRLELATEKLEVERERLRRGTTTTKNTLDYLRDQDDAAHAVAEALRLEALAGVALASLEGRVPAHLGLDLDTILRKLAGLDVTNPTPEIP